MKAAWLVLLAACGKSDPAPKPTPVDKPVVEDAAAIPEPPKPPAFTAPVADTSTWKRIKLSQLGKEKLPFDGTLLIPPGSKTSSEPTYYSDGKRAGQMATITLPDGVEVMLAVRTKVSQKDPTVLKQILERTGAIVMDWRDANGYMLVLLRDDGLIVQGAMWAVEPGLDCATKDPLTQEQLAEALAVCDSFAK